MTTNIKHMKLHGKHRRRIHQPGRNVPWLNANGLWLEQAGFSIGQRVEISIGDRQLIIKAL